MFKDEPEPFEFLTIEEQDLRSDPAYSSTFAKTKIRFRLSEIRWIYEREFYDFFTMISDVGGFQGAIIIFPAFIMSFYSERMFKSSILTQVPIKKNKQTNHHSIPEAPLGDTLDTHTKERLIDEIGSVSL